MLPNWLKKVVLAVAFAAMPFQGFAATLTVLLCHGEPQAHASHIESGLHGADHGHDDLAGHTGQASGDGGSEDTPFFHLCCNLPASVPVSVKVIAAPPIFSVRAFVPDDLYNWFVPDQPQRPPLA